MNEAEFDAYDAVLDSVSKEIVQLRLVLDAAESRQQEREWQKFQLDGELDDARLVDGVAGERHVYRKRGIKQPDIGAPQRLPKRVRFVFDLSGSMYRFNGEDGRLDRSLEAVTMFMEALQGFEHKILYSIVGHSGDRCVLPSLPFFTSVCVCVCVCVCVYCPSLTCDGGGGGALVCTQRVH
eukprot:COSAG06_NODE_978_length_11240_cov_3.328606_5_plen_181_part_00